MHLVEVAARPARARVIAHLPDRPLHARGPTLAPSPLADDPHGQRSSMPSGSFEPDVA